MKVLFVLLSLILPSCEYEDETNCYWDASKQGNGIGNSFIVIEIEKE